MTPTLIPCVLCKTSALWGTLVVPSSHCLRFSATGDMEWYLCRAHAEPFAVDGELIQWEELDVKT